MMSQEEQDMILGRLVRERRESEKRVEALKAKIAAFSPALESFSFALRSVSGKVIHGNEKWISPAEAVKIVDNPLPVEDAAESVRELARESERLADLEARLATLNG
jgi:hypothetical protein